MFPPILDSSWMIEVNLDSSCEPSLDMRQNKKRYVPNYDFLSLDGIHSKTNKQTRYIQSSTNSRRALLLTTSLRRHWWQRFRPFSVPTDKQMDGCLTKLGPAEYQLCIISRALWLKLALWCNLTVVKIKTNQCFKIRLQIFDIWCKNVR